MSAFDVLKVHTLVADESGEARVTKVSPYLRLTSENIRTGLFLKEGKVMDENGVLQDPIPAWVWMEASKCSEAALLECGFDKEAVQKWNSQGDEQQEEDPIELPVQQQPKPKLPSRYKRSTAV